MTAFAPSVLRLASFNTYLISKRYNNNRETSPELRATKIKDFFRQQDITFCQEVWGSGLPELTNNLDGYTVPPYRTSWTLFSRNTFLADIVDTLYLHLLQTGGLFDAAKSTMTCRYRMKHTFTVSRSRSLKGVEATLWDVSSLWGPSKWLLVFHTHLDPWSPENRKIQVREIVHFVGETLAAIDHDSSSSNDTVMHHQQDWSNTGVLVLGDFNIKADTPEYKETLMANDGWVDLFHGDKRQTYAVDNALACSLQDCGRIDFIFRLDRCGATHVFLPLRVVSKSVRKEATGEESSDHFALQVELLPAVS
jgi:hypothetical protein